MSKEQNLNNETIDEKNLEQDLEKYLEEKLAKYKLKKQEDFKVYKAVILETLSRFESKIDLLEFFPEEVLEIVLKDVKKLLEYIKTEEDRSNDVDNFFDSLGVKQLIKIKEINKKVNLSGSQSTLPDGFERKGELIVNKEELKNFYDSFKGIGE